METTQEFAVIQMRKSVEKLASSTQSYGDATLMRFLIARSMDPEKGFYFVQWLKWRSDFVPNGSIPESEVEDELETRKLISRFLDKATLDKIVIMTNEKERRDFIKELGEEVVPEEYGGQAKLVALQDVVIPQFDG
ncbi:Sec14p-like phosphatidylinositol transfer family protein [Euphorbia peplus]|nr:Sec14p-like phosphatidylinositol transfer family protein [Euphorbia peplus]